MDELTKLYIWIGFIVWDMWIILDYEWHKKEVRHDKSRKSRKKSRKTSCHRRCSYYDDLLRGDVGNIYGDYH